jgi:UDP-N-acetylglucosamine 2-epimerase
VKVATIVGARPQFIKAAPVSRAIQKHNQDKSAPQIAEVLVHTGQHYDHGMSQVFFEELGIRKPEVSLGVGSGPHGWQTGQMLMRIEEVLLAEKPDWVMVYGDTNSTLAGALAGSKLNIPVAHVEAGLRSFNRKMPEETNRVLADHCSNLVFCPTRTAVDNLAREGIAHGVHLVGDTMYDAVLQYSEIAERYSTILQDLKLKSEEYLLATVHRPYNTDIPDNLKSILTAFIEIGEPIIFPIHPRTRQEIAAFDGFFKSQIINCNVQFIDPVGYLDMLVLEQHARLILTDSGGVQKEAYFLGVPCVTLRPETEWIETVEAGWNVVVGSERSLIVQKALDMKAPKTKRGAFGDGRAGERILHVLSNTVAQ